MKNFLKYSTLFLYLFGSSIWIHANVMSFDLDANMQAMSHCDDMQNDIQDNTQEDTSECFDECVGDYVIMSSQPTISFEKLLEKTLFSFKTILITSAILGDTIFAISPPIPPDIHFSPYQNFVGKITILVI